MSARTRRIVSSGSTAAYLVAAAAVVGLVTIGLSAWIGDPWRTVTDVSGVVMTLALAPTMLAFYELGGRTPMPLAIAAQAIGWVAVIIWAVLHSAFIGGALSYDYGAPATGALALEQVALVVIGLWVAGANLLAAEWLGWIRWLGVIAGVGFALVGFGLLLGPETAQITYAGGAGSVLVVPIWAFWLARLLDRIAALAG